ncbi:hypothetical protein BH92_06450 [Rhodococcoides fascians A21d2]|uniref:DUF6153 family protein n=1 Tax=Rhodococcoides fascians TaxID=1828 RepID=UPI00055B206F|nr:DUF6153 family protein [Rhodococcus fascians]QIH99556.1 hypothetical protein BH92_06450 [Rhodococcus fascians A21d2]
MHSVDRHGRRGRAVVTTVLIAVANFGVLLMHSVTPTTSMSGAHAAMASVSHHGSVDQVAAAEPDCPSAHQMMHPCAGTTASWPALSGPMAGNAIDVTYTSVEGIGVRAQFASERAPPWTLWELDRSVTLRV